MSVRCGSFHCFSSMVTLNNEAYVSAYNNTYGDLMRGAISILPLPAANTYSYTIRASYRERE